jgi:hypothetical protein
MDIKKPSSIARPSKIYPKWDFCFENIPSCNTGGETPYRIVAWNWRSVTKPNCSGQETAISLVNKVANEKGCLETKGVGGGGQTNLSPSAPSHLHSRVHLPTQSPPTKTGCSKLVNWKITFAKLWAEFCWRQTPNLRPFEWAPTLWKFSLPCAKKSKSSIEVNVADACTWVATSPFHDLKASYSCDSERIYRQRVFLSKLWMTLWSDWLA